MNTSKLNLILFLLPLFILGSLNMAASDKPAVSLQENRALKARPQISLESLLSGEYFRDYEEFFADTFIFRESLVRISQQLEQLRGLPTKDRAAIVSHGGANIVAAGEEDNSGFSEGRILVTGEKAMELHRFNADAGRSYAEAINRLVSKLPEGVVSYSLLVPTQIEFLQDRRYRTLSAPQRETISYINSYLAEGIKPVNVYSALREKANEYIYFRTDHHWTSLGAYYAYRAFMSARGEEPVPLEKYETKDIDGFLGTTYKIVLDTRLERKPDTVTIYEPFIKHEYQVFYDEAVTLDLLDMSYAEQSGKYGVFLGGDHPLGIIRTEIKNGKKIAVIKDSYGNAFVPFLLPHFAEIHVIDPRSFSGNAAEYIRKEGIQEVIFLNYVLAADNEKFSDRLQRITEE